MAATEPILMISPLAAMSWGMKACVTATTAMKLVSKHARASSRSTSRAGRVRFLPLCHALVCVIYYGTKTHALLTKMSSLPPLSFSTSFRAASLLSALVTSRLTVEMPICSKSARESRLRAEAITCRPT